MDTKELTNSTLLSWQKPLNGKLKGYYVLLRETSSPVWQKKFFTKETKLRIPYSKDNYLFGVQAFGVEGNEGEIVGF